MTKTAKTKPLAVLISDIHFTPTTLELASRSLAGAITEAESLGVPVVIPGDLLDTKDIIRAQCANRIISILSQADPTQVYVIPGNHDLVNEKGSEHALNFLRPYCQLVQAPTYIPTLESWLVPYQTDPEVLRAFLKGLPEGARLIMHQGVQTAYLGHYTQDKTSLTTDDFANFRVISGHYHRRQDIKCGRPRRGAVGLFSYIGNPYTLTFGEASDPEKGFQVLMSDGLLEFVPTNLRKHVVYSRTTDELSMMMEDDPWLGCPAPDTNGDLLWLKITGPKSVLDTLSKTDIGNKLGLGPNFKLDKIPYESEESTPANKPKDLTEAEVLDTLIDNISETDTRKVYLKSLWREITE